MTAPPDHDPAELIAAVLALAAAGDFDAADALADLAAGVTPDGPELTRTGGVVLLHPARRCTSNPTYRTRSPSASRRI